MYSYSNLIFDKVGKCCKSELLNNENNDDPGEWKFKVLIPAIRCND